MNVEQAAREPDSPRRAQNLLDRKSTAWITLAITLLVTLVAWRHSDRDHDRISHERFLLLAESARMEIVDRMDDYEQVLRGGAALFWASDEVDRERWRAYVDELELEEYLPGIQGTGFTVMLPARERAAHEAAVRAEGYPDYEVYPASDDDSFSSIVYLEPFTGRNLRAFGFDMYTDPVRREAMDRARDTGQPALSGKVVLVQETAAGVQPGFLMYMPVYRTGMPRGTVSERRAALRGFVYSPFRAFDLMDAVLGHHRSDVEIELFDGLADPENLLYESKAGGREADHVTDMSLEVAGHQWVARFYSSRAFEASRASVQPLVILLGGLALDLLLFVVLYMSAQHRQRMREAAAALEQSRDSFKALVENIPGSVFRSRIEGAGEVEHVSVGIEALTGQPRERYLSGEITFEELIYPDDRPRVQAAIADAIAKRAPYHIEYRVLSSNGRVRWVAERGRASYGANGRPEWLDSVILDIDEGKRAEMAIRELAFHDPLTGLPNRRLLLDRLEHQLATASRTGKPGAVMFLDLDNFKGVNDSLGHNVGDQLLVEVAHRLRAHFREQDTISRLGGDEFVVLIDELGGSSDEAPAMAAALAQKILDELNRPYELGDHVCVTTPSVGVALFTGAETSPDQVLRRADQAMYDAKAAGRNRVCFYE